MTPPILTETEYAERRTYCRICPGACGLIVAIRDNRAVAVRPDPDHPGSRGYVCVKGLAYPEMHHSPVRLRKPLRRQPAGGYETLPSMQALDEVADRLARILERHGPRSVAMFYGTAITGNSLHLALALAFFKALGSTSIYSTMTIDQSAKWVTEARLGRWAAGRQAFAGADVWLVSGSNPFVSLQGSMIGWPTFAPPLRLKEARERGLKLIVIDPVRTHTAAHADLYLQPFPGEDAVLFAAIVRQILDRGWHDRQFCDRYVNGLIELHRALAPFELEAAARATGVRACEIEAVAQLFARDSKRGMAAGGTGPDMSPASNLAEHLIETLNVICGRYPREGDPVSNPGVLHPYRPRRAEVLGPHRSFDGEPRSRDGRYGSLHGQMMSGVLAEEILVPGNDQLRALFCVGSNPAAALPNQRRAVAALKTLDLLVTSDWWMSQTAQLAHFVFAPTLALERPDHTHFLESFAFDSESFAQFTPALIGPESSDDLVDDWYLYWALGKRLGLRLRVAGTDLDMNHKPSTHDLLALFARRSQVPLSEVAEHPSGAIFRRPAQFVEAARTEVSQRFELAAPDVLQEIKVVATRLERHTSVDARYTYRLVCRRDRETMNSVGVQLDAIRRRMATNPAHLHSSDAERLGLIDGDQIEILSEAGQITTQTRIDDAVRPGVVSMNHGWGGLPDGESDQPRVGSSTCELVSTHCSIEAINAMPRMSAIPVEIRRLRLNREEIPMERKQ